MKQTTAIIAMLSIVARCYSSSYSISVPAGTGYTCGAYQYQDASVSSALGTVPDGFYMWVWKDLAQSYDYIEYVFGAWNNASYTLHAGDTLLIGEGASSFTLTISGTPYNQQYYISGMYAQTWSIAGRHALAGYLDVCCPNTSSLQILDNNLITGVVVKKWDHSSQNWVSWTRNSSNWSVGGGTSTFGPYFQVGEGALMTVPSGIGTAAAQYYPSGSHQTCP